MLYQLSYIHHMFAESIGIEPNTRRYISLSRRTLSPSRFTFHCRHSRNRTYVKPINLSTTYQAEGICAVFCGTGRTRTYNLLINSQALRQLRYCSICWWERRDLNPHVLTETVLQTAEPTNCSTLPYCVPDRVRTCDPSIKSGVL